MYERLDGKHLNKEFVLKVENELITFAKEEQSLKKSNKMRCPCNKCWNIPYLDEDTVKLHLYKYGFRLNYFHWINHGETYPGLEVNNEGSPNAEIEPIQEMFMDAFGPMSSNWIDENMDKEPNA